MSTSTAKLLLVWACAGVALSAVARAETLQAPPVFMAQPDGSFSYIVWLRKGPGVAQFGGENWFGSENVEGRLIGDGFCGWTVEPGKVVSFEVVGRLKNTSLSGTVFQSIYFCDAPGDDSTTVIQPYSPLSVGDPPITGNGVLWNEPNPFSRRTTFHFTLAEPADVELTVHDVAGRLVARVLGGMQPAGPQQVTWEPSTDAGATAARGVLFARLRVRGAVYTRRVILVQ